MHARQSIARSIPPPRLSLFHSFRPARTSYRNFRAPSIPPSLLLMFPNPCRTSDKVKTNNPTFSEGVNNASPRNSDLYKGSESTDGAPQVFSIREQHIAMLCHAMCFAILIGRTNVPAGLELVTAGRNFARAVYDYDVLCAQ